jgi:hypothetical protein
MAFDECEGIPGIKQLAGKLNARRFVTGHDFSRAENVNQINRALAPVGCFSSILPQIPHFSASCKTPDYYCQFWHG